MNTVLIALPTYRRPERMAALAQNVAEKTKVPHRLLFVCDDNRSMETARLNGLYAVRNTHTMGYAGAINCAAARSTDALWLFAGSDSIQFGEDWVGKALSKMYDPQWCVIGVSGEGLLIRVSYAMETGCTVDRVPGVMCFEGYHFKDWCLKEVVMTAKHRDVYTECDGCSVKRAFPRTVAQDDRQDRMAFRQRMKDILKERRSDQHTARW